MHSEQQPWENVAPNASSNERPPDTLPEPPPHPDSGPIRQEIGWFERLLHPETLQRMMLCGGGLLILGFVVWLWSCGVFDNPLVLATVVGSVNLALIGIGIVLVRTTRYELTGQGLALLGSLALPLNLWLYHAQGLIVITTGGHLWVPALVCCLIYAGVARSLRNPHLVYALVSGVILTGLLFLADLQINRFWEVLPVTTLLVVIGAACSVVSNFFPVSGDFSRDRFGTAFFRAGQLSLTAGLVLLGGGQLSALLIGWISFLEAFPIPTELLAGNAEKWWACGLTIGALALQLSIRPERQTALRLPHSIVLGGWSMGNLLLALNVTLTLQAIVIGLSCIVVALNVARLAAGKTLLEKTNGTWPSLYLLGGYVSSVLLALWSILYFAFHVSGDLNRLSQVDWTIWTTIQFSLAALACWTCDKLWWSRPLKPRTLIPIYLGAVTLSLAGLSLVASAGWGALPLGLLGPTAAGLAITLAGFWLAAETSPSLRHATLGCVLTVITLPLLNVATSTHLFSTHQLQWILFGILNAAICGWLSMSQRSVTASIGLALLLSFSTAEAISLTNLSFDYSFLVALSGLGLANQLLRRFALHHITEDTPEALGGHLLGISGGVGSILLALSELASGQATLGLLGFLALQAVICGLLSLSTKSEALTLSFRLITYSCLVFTGIVLFQVANLYPAQKVELLAAAIGLFILVLSHWGLYREYLAGKTDETVTLGLWLGSLTTVIPLVAGLLVYRVAIVDDPVWLWAHEFGVLLTGLAMFGVGSLLQTRATTLVGGTTLALYIASLLFLVPWPDQLQNTSVLMMVLGGLFFLVAILLSAYRERLIQIPGKIKSGEGIYRVLKWR